MIVYSKFSHQLGQYDGMFSVTFMELLIILYILYFVVELLLLHEIEILLTTRPTQINHRTLQYKHLRIAVSLFIEFMSTK